MSPAYKSDAMFCMILLKRVMHMIKKRPQHKAQWDTERSIKEAGYYIPSPYMLLLFLMLLMIVWLRCNPLHRNTLSTKLGPDDGRKIGVINGVENSRKIDHGEYSDSTVTKVAHS